MSQTLDIVALLGHLPLFRTLHASQLDALARASQPLRVPKNGFVFHRGDAARGLYVLVVGSVALAIPASSGQEKVIEFFGPGQAFGEAVMFLGQPQMMNARALQDSLLLWLDKDDICAVIDQDPSFARRLLSSLSQRLQGLVQDIETINLQDATQRIIGFLLQQPREGHTVRIPFSKHLIASKLGLAPETLSRLLHQLCSAGLISVHGRTVTLHDSGALQQRLLQS